MNASHSGSIHTIFARRRRVPSLVLSTVLALVSSSSCSRQEKTVEKEATEPAPTLPSGAMKLSDVLKSLESRGYAPIVEVEFEKDHWKIKAYSKGQLLQLKADLMSGAVLPDDPPKLDKPLSDVVKSLEEQGYGPILDIERGGAAGKSVPAWDVEAFRGKSEVKITVDAAGKVAPK